MTIGVDEESMNMIALDKELTYDLALMHAITP